MVSKVYWTLDTALMHTQNVSFSKHGFADDVLFFETIDFNSGSIPAFPERGHEQDKYPVAVPFRRKTVVKEKL